MSDVITLCDAWAFRRAYKKGKSFVSPELVTYVIKNKNNNLRVGITTGKKIGKAVVRSRARRVIRAAFAQLCKEEVINTSGFDVVFVARGRTPLTKSTELAPVMKKHFKNVGLIKEL